MRRRTFLVAAGSSSLLLPAARAFALERLEASAVRTAPGAVRLRWAGSDPPLRVGVSPDPDAPWSTAQRVPSPRSGARELTLTLPARPRPYFLLSRPDGRLVRVAERSLPLQGGRNFRDLGGYYAADGRQVRWGRLYRSGVMSGLTAGDQSYLADLGLTVICDLRGLDERMSRPNPFLKSERPSVVGIDYVLPSEAGYLALRSREQAVSAFVEEYLAFVDLLAPHYTDLFHRLVAGQTPLAFNCTAGKDRTGLATALILSVLGVPRRTIIADYVLTEQYASPAYFLREAAKAVDWPGKEGGEARALVALAPDVARVLLGAAPEVMARTLAEIDGRWGGPVALAKSRYGLTDSRIADLRAAYLV